MSRIDRVGGGSEANELQKGIKGSLSSARSWALLLLLAIGPFLLKTGLNLESVQRQAVAQIYRNLRFSYLFKDVPHGSSVIFERRDEKSLLEDAFRVQLQSDFKLLEIGEAPRVRVFFDAGTFLEVRVELQELGEANWKAWNYSARFINNGLLLGMWLGLLVWIYFKRMRLAASVSIFSMLLWQVDWNLLEVPGFLFRSGRDLVSEIIFRVESNKLMATEVGRLVDLSVVIWFLFAVTLFRLFSWRFRGMANLSLVLVSFLLEPLFLWIASGFARWGADTSWWKIYLGSFSYRYLLFSHLFLVFLRPGYFKFHHRIRVPRFAKEQNAWLFYLLPVVFVFCGGWSWVQSVFVVGGSLALLRLKLFFAGWILAFTMGSRVFSLWVAVLAFAVIAPPSQGHWVSAANFGILLDGLLLGWFLTPFKGRVPVLALGISKRRFMAVTAMAWLLGIFLSSVGAPSAISWATLAVAIWGYAQLSEPDSGTSSEVNTAATGG